MNIHRSLFFVILSDFPLIYDETIKLLNYSQSLSDWVTLNGAQATLPENDIRSEYPVS